LIGGAGIEGFAELLVVGMRKCFRE